ncbi:uncharacterized protein L3040_006846 [Drepanopeziza brunnea f. sp. 'multigermtubi']|uniref:uncharacterized protein n=1 Tax=Drepanopeziza brunnea f. sp. 'multigermtubi' TaxID=698441 RepID=UPI00239DDAE4|nr:hypothetical protein L3040_006846 [Drepanopeziza brunnea f. sp. 'multigermtubi']
MDRKYAFKSCKKNVNNFKLHEAEKDDGCYEANFKFRSEKGHKPAHSARRHGEKHATNGPMVRDLTIGAADGLRVPFALTASLSSGLAELFSGAITMGLEQRDHDDVRDFPEDEKAECCEMLGKHGVKHDTLVPVIDELALDTDRWGCGLKRSLEYWRPRFMMGFELKLEKPQLSVAWVLGATTGISYFIGGLIPAIPYFAMHNVMHTLFVSIGVTVVTLMVFGFAKNYDTMQTKRAGLYGSVQTTIIGVLAADTSYGIVRAIDSSDGKVGGGG